MKLTGIIAEYNPFHSGHEFHINKSKELTGSDFCVVVMSGDFVQRGEPAVYSKYLRTRMALACGADLVVEMPSVFAVSSAEDFAACGVALLTALGAVDTICFGSEDGSIQGRMQVAGVPCVGPGVTASASCMDKTMTKLVVGETGVRQANWYLARRQSIQEDLGRLVRDIESGGDYPLFVKPSGTGSSVGVSKVRNTQELKDALKKAAEYDDKVLVEEFISGHEVEVAVLGNKNPIASVVGEVIAGAEFYDYDAKYISTESRTEIPADISPDASERLRKAAVTVYEALGCKGLSRVDFFLTYEGEEVVFNEINTIPGFTSISMYPKLFEAAGVPNDTLIDELISLAMEG